MTVSNLRSARSEAGVILAKAAMSAVWLGFAAYVLWLFFGR